MPLTDFIPEEFLKFVKISGTTLLERIGHQELREIVAGVLCGDNVRAATEPLTRHRISALNAAVFLTIARASKAMSPEALLTAAHSEFRSLRSSDPRRSVLMWILGLTKKQVQNVLRSDDEAWFDFIESAKHAAEESANYTAEVLGDLKWTVAIDDLTTELDWLWAHTLMISVGSQALATRGAEKSMYGKFFEKLILGSVLDVLGFELDRDRRGGPMTYWLSERSEKRESDATAIVQDRQGVRFDIGFIGRGNSEISLDKVSRFARVAEIQGRVHEMATIVIVDQIGDGSGITSSAAEIDGKILQMSSSLWAKDLDAVLGEKFDQYSRVFTAASQANDVRRAVVAKLSEADLQGLITAVK